VMGAVPANRRGIASAFRTTAWNVGYTISLNLAIVLMSFTLPYQTVSALISSNISTISASSRELFVESLKSTYFWLGVINTTAIIPSLFGYRIFKSKKQEAPVKAITQQNKAEEPAEASRIDGPKPVRDPVKLN